MSDLKQKSEKIKQLTTEFHRLMDDGKTKEAFKIMKEVLQLSNSVLEECNNTLRKVLGKPPQPAQPTKKDEFQNIVFPNSKYIN